MIAAAPRAADPLLPLMTPPAGSGEHAAGGSAGPHPPAPATAAGRSRQRQAAHPAVADDDPEDKAPTRERKRHARASRTPSEHHPHPAAPVPQRHRPAHATRDHQSPRAHAPARHARQIPHGDDAAAPDDPPNPPPPLAPAGNQAVSGARIRACEGQRAGGDVRVRAFLVGMGMVAVVLIDPPAVAQPDARAERQGCSWPPGAE
jgi:hypothetical protein